MRASVAVNAARLIGGRRRNFFEKRKALKSTTSKCSAVSSDFIDGPLSLIAYIRQNEYPVAVSSLIFGSQTLLQ